jgi:hypothetical protein
LCRRQAQRLRLRGLVVLEPELQAGDLVRTPLDARIDDLAKPRQITRRYSHGIRHGVPDERRRAPARWVIIVWGQRVIERVFEKSASTLTPRASSP